MQSKAIWSASSKTFTVQLRPKTNSGITRQGVATAGCALEPETDCVSSAPQQGVDLGMRADIVPGT